MRFVHLPARIVEAKLVLWKPGIPGIWFRYHDGMETIANATYDTYEIQAAIETLTDEDQKKVTRALETYHTVRALLFYGAGGTSEAGFARDSSRDFLLAR